MIINDSVKNWIEQEIRLAMQQQAQFANINGIDRAAIAKLRTERITRKLLGESPVPLTNIPQEDIDMVSKQLLSVD